MRNWKKVAQRVAARLDRKLDETRRAVREHDRIPSGVVEIHPFRGYGTAARLHVLGRVLRQPRIALATNTGSGLSNLVDSFRRLASEEIAGARIVAEVEGRTVESQTDDEGYFHIAVEGTFTGYCTAAVRAVEPPSREAVTVEVFVPSPMARFGVISDIDDTVVETNATGLVRMARTVFMQNARGRLATAGIAEFYRALSVAGTNPFFYVSSSPWNFFDLLDHFLALNGIPTGPLMLQDYGVDDSKLIHSAHDDHKLAQIEEILATYESLPFVLIGDSGQRDPEIYREAARRFGNRIRAIYIRDVTSAARDAEVQRIASELTANGSQVLLFTHGDEAMQHARSIGLIT